MEVKLVISHHDGVAETTVIREYPIVRFKTTIGRNTHADIHLDAPSVSGEHAVLTHHGMEITLEDLKSTNGTQVNGVPIHVHTLQVGDVIDVFPYQLT